MSLTIIMTLVIYIFFSPKLSLLFLDASEVDLSADARLYLLVTGAFYIPLALVNIIRFMIQDMGFSGFAVFSGVFERMARTTTGFRFVQVFGYAAACFASPAAWFWRMLSCFLLILLCKEIEKRDETDSGVKSLAV